MVNDSSKNQAVGGEDSHWVTVVGQPLMQDQQYHPRTEEIPHGEGHHHGVMTDERLERMKCPQSDRRLLRKQHVCNHGNAIRGDGCEGSGRV